LSLTTNKANQGLKYPIYTSLHTAFGFDSANAIYAFLELINELAVNLTKDLKAAV
jgi:hypothetical protein